MRKGRGDHMRFPTPVNLALTDAAAPAAEDVLAAASSVAVDGPYQRADAADAGTFRLNQMRWVRAAAGKTEGPK